MIHSVSMPHYFGLLTLAALISGLSNAAAQTSAPSNSASPNSKDKPVAVFGSDALYEKDYLPQIQSKLNEIHQQEYEFKRKAIENAVNKRLLKAKAAKQGVTEDELLLQVDSKAAEPTQEDRDQAIAARLFGGGAASNVGEELDKDLTEEKVQQAREEYFASLREQAGVKIYLLPPQTTVAMDPARVRGKADAKITMVEFSDFQCPFCLQAYTTVKSLLKKYDGKVKLSYRDLPLLPTPPGVPGSAEAARCAGEQGKYWEYHDLLFENQDDVGREAFLDHAETVKLDLEQFKTCLDSGKFKAAVQQDFQEGIRLGLTGTPGFFINGVMLKGAQPLAEFEEIIDTELFLMEP